MPLILAPHVHAAAIGDDLVLLDVARDAYFCLVGGARVLALEADGRVVIGDPQAEAALREGGMVVDGALRPAQPVLGRVRDSVEVGFERAIGPAWPADRRGGPARASLGGVTAAGARTALDFGRWRFSQLVAWAGRRPVGETRRFSSPTPALTVLAAAFGRLRVWSPFDGACLMRSYMMLRFLRRRGQDAAWVIGVRTWPFMAHCWLQSGDVALDDDVERLVSFTPILVI